VCFSMLQCAMVYFSVLQCDHIVIVCVIVGSRLSKRVRVVVCCSVLQFAAVCCSVLWCVRIVIVSVRGRESGQRRLSFVGAFSLSMLQRVVVCVVSMHAESCRADDNTQFVYIFTHTYIQTNCKLQNKLFCSLFHLLCSVLQLRCAAVYFSVLQYVHASLHTKCIPACLHTSRILEFKKCVECKI